jgi:hypothetical protein
MRNNNIDLRCCFDTIELTTGVFKTPVFLFSEGAL